MAHNTPSISQPVTPVTPVTPLTSTSSFLAPETEKTLGKENAVTGVTPVTPAPLGCGCEEDQPCPAHAQLLAEYEKTLPTHRLKPYTNGIRKELAVLWKIPPEAIYGEELPPTPQIGCRRLRIHTYNPLDHKSSHTDIRHKPAAKYTKGWPPGQKTKDGAGLPVQPIGLIELAARDTDGLAIITEGISDYFVARFIFAGYNDITIIGAQGTSNIHTAAHTIKEHGWQHIVIITDNDQAGIKAANTLAAAGLGCGFATPSQSGQDIKDAWHTALSAGSPDTARRSLRTAIQTAATAALQNRHNLYLIGS